ncbi:MAG: DNA polymerase I [Acidimicrobiia bacterium]
MPVLALLDGHSLAYRAFFALPQDLQTQSGQLTNSAYGFTSMLIKMLGDHHPQSVVVAWDSGRTTFRTEAFPDYKAQRESAPDAFRTQLPLIKEVLESLQVTQLELPGYEADDLIASVNTRAAKEGWDVLIVTGDRDAFQLISDHTKVLYTRRGISDIVLADSAWVSERYGILPEQYTDYAALRGDTSDNLPGVPGVGEKTASRLISTYADLEGVYESLEELTPKLRENLDLHRDQVFLNRQLMRLASDLEVEFELAETSLTDLDRPRVKQVFETLEFFSLWDRFLDLDIAEGAGDILEVEMISATSQATADRLLGTDPLSVVVVHDAGGIAGVAAALSEEEVLFFPEDRLELLAPILSDPEVTKVTHDAKGLIRVLWASGIEPAGLSFDVALAAYLLNPGSRSYELEDLASRYLGMDLGASADDEAADDGQLQLSAGPDLERSAQETVATSKLAPVLAQQLKDRDEQDLFDEIEMPLAEVLARMEATGIRVDRGYLEELGESLRDQLATLERQIHAEAEEPFNINSTTQLREVLFEQLSLPVLRKTAKGVPSTDASVLQKLSDAHPIVDKLLRYRELEKLRSTYVDGYVPLIAPDGRIHASFNQMGSTTGRLSSEQPNLQNIPVRSEAGMTIRKAFIPTEEWSFIVADYSQIELRILAHMSGDPVLGEAFSSEEADIHTATAARVFDMDPSNVTTQMRRMAKTINFGLIYGMEAFGLADRLDISREEAAEYIETYFGQFPDVQEFRERIVAEARARGYTTTAFGRRRYLPELSSDNYRIRQMGERMALNAPVQGTAADIIKRAMIDLDRELRTRDAELLLQVHDELVLEAPPSELTEVSKLTRRVMEDAASLNVPLRVDLGGGTNLAESK